MSISVEKTGKTIEAAIQAALEELNVNEEDVIIEVLEEGDAGKLLGIGKKDAKVRVSIEDDKTADTVYFGDDEEYSAEPASSQEAAAVDFVTKVLSGIGVRGEITSYTEGETIYIDVSGRDVGAIIGRHGETLDAIQYLATLVINKHTQEHFRLVLDIGGYRKRREETLISLAHRTAEKVVKVGKSYEMEPMNAAERRIIHFALQEYPGITTFSEGEDPERCVIISPVKE